MAEGFVTIAVENMANAIKKISVQRGYDVTEYLLNCFGGAGGQHACLVADALGMEAVLIHPFSGLLSAYGIGLSGVFASRQQALLKPLAEESLADDRPSSCDSLRDAVFAELAAQGIAADDVAWRPVLHIRYDGTDTTLPVNFGDGSLDDARASVRGAAQGAVRLRLRRQADGRRSGRRRRQRQPRARPRAKLIQSLQAIDATPSANAANLRRRRLVATPASSAARRCGPGTAVPARR